MLIAAFSTGDNWSGLLLAQSLYVLQFWIQQSKYTLVVLGTLQSLSMPKYEKAALTAKARLVQFQQSGTNLQCCSR